MPDLRLDYFDFHGGRGEVARLIMSIGGIEFVDHRIPPPDWPTRKHSTPLGALPVMHVGDEQITQTNAICRYLGKMANLYPQDDLDALRCDEIMSAVEDILNEAFKTFFIEDEDEKKKRRIELAEGPLTNYLKFFSQRLDARGGKYFVEDRLTIADIKVFVWVRGLRKGVLDYVPADIVDTIAPNLAAHCDRVAKEPGIVAWYDAH